MQVAALLARTPAREELLAAALLHDVVERSEVTVSDIESRFGPEVGGLVAALTEDERLEDYEERKAAHRNQVVVAGRDAAAVFVADKLAKAIELRRVMRGSDQPATATMRARLRHYEQTVETVTLRFPRLPLLGDLRRELESIRAEHPNLLPTRRGLAQGG